MTGTALQREAWRVLEGESAILDAARDMSRILRKAKIRGAIVGGIAVGLHGHVRATMDVDVYVPEPLEDFAQALVSSGRMFDARRREFRRGGAHCVAQTFGDRARHHKMRKKHAPSGNLSPLGA